MPACRLCLRAAGLLGLLLLTHLSGAGAGAEKPGVCPQLQSNTDCVKECSSDNNCQDNLKCCQAGCSSVCSPPNEKQGACPSVDFPKLGICEDQCQVDTQCPGNMKCCRNGCGKMTCATPKF
ncbi:WAP four-disulfide core domain protein 2 [Cricetulus griseus]|uniref:WAP four-disulfide core domain protein 2 n=1 Tax=Cricetulus griseus TaxID=10029 RepID=A0A9J7KA85_CRIGR|nr:WAP four-disulfide core domain protein 2 [Cricetulus griseus]XP_035313107.1 WAP four-disulfide core domain protein 2 [Cricetulus griseus]ERE71609.1 WAP four-disulfide core domain protein 2 [Cricetulus griseus]